MISKEIVEEIRLRADIVDIIGSRVNLKHAGGLFKACCPFHQEKTPSFTVYPDDRTFHCFGCQEHGDVFSFLMRHEGLTFQDAVKLLAQKTGVELSEIRDPMAAVRQRLHTVHAAVAEFFQRCLTQTREASFVRDYLDEREIGDEARENFLLGYSPRRARTLERWAEKNSTPVSALIEAGLLTERASSSERKSDGSYYERFRGRLIFPIRDPQGRIVAFSGRIMDQGVRRAAKYVNSPETPIFHKGSTLYALDKARSAIVKSPHREALVCEGQIDVIRCHSHGFSQAVAAQGTAFTVDHVRVLKRYADSAVLVFDSDAAGTKAAIKAAELFLHSGMVVRVASLPDADDPDTFLRREGPERFAERLRDAESISFFMVKALQRNEPHPDAVDATDRIARALIEVLSGCENAIQRARLVQDASRALSLPEEALHEELNRRRSTLKERERNREARGLSSRPASTSAVSADKRPASEDRPFMNAPASAADSESQPLSPMPEELALCELVCQHSDDRGVLEAISRFLPPGLARFEPCRTILAAAVITSRTEQDALLQLQEEGSAAVRRWIDRLATSDHRMATAREASPEEAARHCIMRLWRRHLALERTRIAAIPSPASGENLRRRKELTELMKRLQCLDWEGVESQLRKEAESLSGRP